VEDCNVFVGHVLVQFDFVFELALVQLVPIEYFDSDSVGIVLAFEDIRKPPFAYQILESNILNAQMHFFRVDIT